MTFPILRLNLIPPTKQQKHISFYIFLCTLIPFIIIASAKFASFGSITVDQDEVDQDEVDHDYYIDHQINMEMEIIGLNPASGYLAAWIRLSAMSGGLHEAVHPNCSSLPPRIFDVFLDQNVTAERASQKGNNRSNRHVRGRAVFRLTEHPCSDPSKRSEPGVRIWLRLLAVDQGSGRYRRVSNGYRAYPFDSYYTGFHLHAEERLPGDHFRDVSIRLDNVGGVVPNFQTKFRSSLDVTEGGLDISLHVSRPISIMLFCIGVITANWVLSLVVLWVSVASLLSDDGDIGDLFIMLAAGFWSLMLMRGGLPGAPTSPGSLIDLTVFLPNVAVLALCGVVLIFSRIESVKGESERAPGSDAETVAIGSKEAIY